MPRPVLSRDARDFLGRLEGKHAKQILLRILDLCENPRPHDSAELKGSAPYLRIDQGEYRIIYRVEDDTLFIHTVGDHTV